MSDRYEILEILGQDDHGVVFQANDRQSGTTVVLRRFFPFGAASEGLSEEEKAAYEIALHRLKEVDHPALRRVLDGGTDEIDGMPFLVTEWREGTLLSTALGRLDHPVATARLLAESALDASLLLSRTFQEEALWVETTPESIVFPSDGSAPGVTFWICPIRWLGDSSQRQNLAPLLALVEKTAGWNGQIISDGAGEGLGRWVNTLRKNLTAWSLREAREALRPIQISSATGQAAKPASAPTVPVGQSRIKVKPPKSNPWPWILAAVLTLAAGAFIFLQSQKKSEKVPTVASIENQKPPTGGPPPEKAQSVSELEEEPPRAISPAEVASAAKPDPEPTPAPTPQPELSSIEERAKQLAKERADSEIFLVGKTYTIEGEVTDTSSSRSGDTVYCRIRTEGGKSHWIAMWRKLVDSYDKETVSVLEGKWIRVNGKLRRESGSRRGEVFSPQSNDDITVIDR